MDHPYPRTLIVDLSVRYGGTSSRVLSLLEHLPPGRVGLAGLRGSAILEKASAGGFATHVVGDHKLDLSIPARLARTAREEGFQVFDTQNVQSKLWTSRAVRRGGVAFVSTLNSWYFDEHGGDWKGRLYQSAERATSRDLDLYITVSSRDKASLMAQGFPEDGIVVIRNAVALDPDAIQGDRAWLLERFALPPDAIVVVSAGRLVPVKGYPEMIGAVGSLASDLPIYYLIMGSGEEESNLHALIHGAGLGERVRLLGWRERSEVLQIIKTADVFAMPSRYEGTPVALLEAAALARPILATKAGGMPDQVTDGEHALLAQPGDSADLARQLKRLCVDRALAEQLGRQAQARTLSEFTPVRQAEATMQAHHKAYERARARTAG